LPLRGPKLRSSGKVLTGGVDANALQRPIAGETKRNQAGGTVKGAGSALVWSIRYFVRALTGSGRIASSVALALFWLRYFDGLTKERPNADAASAVFFLWKKIVQ